MKDTSEGLNNSEESLLKKWPHLKIAGSQPHNKLFEEKTKTMEDKSNPISKMLVEYTNKSGSGKFTQEVSSVREAFEFINSVQKVFEESKCCNCDSEDIRYDVREHKKSNDEVEKYYRIVCNSCGAQLDLINQRDGNNLFAKRYDRDKQPLGKNGWYIYNKNGG